MILLFCSLPDQHTTSHGPRELHLSHAPPDSQSRHHMCTSNLYTSTAMSHDTHFGEYFFNRGACRPLASAVAGNMSQQRHILGLGPRRGSSRMVYAFFNVQTRVRFDKKRAVAVRHPDRRQHPHLQTPSSNTASDSCYAIYATRFM